MEAFHHVEIDSLGNSIVNGAFPLNYLLIPRKFIVFIWQTFLSEHAWKASLYLALHVGIGVVVECNHTGSLLLWNYLIG